jgi:hypothetical protein
LVDGYGQLVLYLSIYGHWYDGWWESLILVGMLMGMIDAYGGQNVWLMGRRSISMVNGYCWSIWSMVMGMMAVDDENENVYGKYGYGH